jgi:ribosome-associated protein
VDIEIQPDLIIPQSEIRYTASRSGGPGGQNVNKVSSRVTLEFDVRNSTAISPAQRRRIEEKLRSRISKEGVLRVTSQRTRSQDLNRTHALERFIELLREALHQEAHRTKTSVPKAARNERLTMKKQRTVTKQLRARKNWDVD